MNVFTRRQARDADVRRAGLRLRSADAGRPRQQRPSPVVPTLAFNTDTNNTNMMLRPAVSSRTPTGTVLHQRAAELDELHLHVHGRLSSTRPRYIGFFNGDNPDPDPRLRRPRCSGSDSDATKTGLNPVPPDTGYDPERSTDVTGDDPHRRGTDRRRSGGCGSSTVPTPPARGPRPPTRCRSVSATRCSTCATGSHRRQLRHLKFPRTDVVTGEEIPANIANGPAGTVDRRGPPVGDRQPGPGRPVQRRHQRRGRSAGTNLREGTNCVDTDTGLSAQFATKGLVQGGTGTRAC